jgi:hypothetical protein
MTEDERTALKMQEQDYILKGYYLARQLERQQRVCETRRRQYEQACALLTRREQALQCVTRMLHLVTEQLHAPSPPTEAELDRVEAEILDATRWHPLTAAERHERAMTWLYLTEQRTMQIEHALATPASGVDPSFGALCLTKLKQRREHLQRYLLLSEESHR